jgi:hypothetical protein
VLLLPSVSPAYSPFILQQQATQNLIGRAAILWQRVITRPEVPFIWRVLAGHHYVTESTLDYPFPFAFHLRVSSPKEVCPSFTLRQYPFRSFALLGFEPFPFSSPKLLHLLTAEPCLIAPGTVVAFHPEPNFLRHLTISCCGC